VILINEKFLKLLKSLKIYSFCKLIYKYFFKKLFLIELNNNENHVIKKYTNKIAHKIIDIGAHKGDKTEIFLNFFPKDRYFLFEPFNAYYDSLINKFKKKNNIKIFNLAVSNFNGEHDFYYSKKIENSEGFSLIENTYLEEKIKIEVIKLDDFINDKQNFKLIKMDAEGLEPKIIEGSKNLITQSNPLLLIETNHITYQTIENLLYDLNYNLYVYEFYLFKNKNIDYRSLGDLTKINSPEIVSNNTFDKKIYKFKNLDDFKYQFLANCFAINKKHVINYINMDLKEIF